MNIIRLSLIALIVSACQSKPGLTGRDDVRVAAAGTFTERYSHSRLSAWNVRGTVVGNDCDVLLVETSIIMEESMVEALHYGAGAYGVYDGGVQRFSHDRAFRGVAYKDSSGRIWTYGNVSAVEVAAMKRCD